MTAKGGKKHQPGLSAAKKAESERDQERGKEQPVKTPRKAAPKTKRSDRAMPTGLVGRAGRLAASSVKGSMRLAMIGPRALLGTKTTQTLFEDFHSKTAKELAETLGRLKGASMKVGQLASFIDAGILPPELRDVYQEVFGSLREGAPPMKSKLIKDVFRNEFDAQPLELFAHFDETPVAAASLGQVHYATLEDGRSVAVKIQYPGIEAAIKSDLAMTAAVKPLVPLLAPGLEVDEALEEIRQRVLEECDYTLEAENMDTLADQYAGHPFVFVPRSIPDRSSERILTMERVNGIPFEKLKKLPKAEKDRVGEILFRFYYGSLHRYGFTSADPHPGNYRLMDDGRMAFFDFGLAFTLDPTMSPYFLGTLLALRDGDVDSFFEHGVKMRFVTKPKETDPQRFFDWVAMSLEPLRHDREYTFTRDFIARRTEPMMDPRSEWWPFIRRLNLPRWALLLYRLELGLFAVLAQLGATANWHRITMEFYGALDPETELGQAEWEWLQEASGPKQTGVP